MSFSFQRPRCETVFDDVSVESCRTEYQDECAEDTVNTCITHQVSSRNMVFIFERNRRGKPVLKEQIIRVTVNRWFRTRKFLVGWLRWLQCGNSFFCFIFQVRECLTSLRPLCSLEDEERCSESPVPECQTVKQNHCTTETKVGASLLKKVSRFKGSNEKGWDEPFLKVSYRNFLEEKLKVSEVFLPSSRKYLGRKLLFSGRSCS